jgi:hypothetical protein
VDEGPLPHQVARGVRRAHGSRLPGEARPALDVLRDAGIPSLVASGGHAADLERIWTPSPRHCTRSGWSRRCRALRHRGDRFRRPTRAIPHLGALSDRRDDRRPSRLVQATEPRRPADSAAGNSCRAVRDPRAPLPDPTIIHQLRVSPWIGWTARTRARKQQQVSALNGLRRHTQSDF